MTRQDNLESKAYNPQFNWRFLLPQHWGSWLGMLFVALISFFPAKIRLGLAKFLATFVIKAKSKANRRARVNLAMCFPEKSEQERESILYQSYVTSLSFLMSFPSLTLRSKKWLEKHTTINGLEYLQAEKDQQHNIILLTPHTWAIDIPAVLLASRGLLVCGMIKAQKNPVTDWLMHRQRVQYGGHVYPRNAGIKPFLQSIKQGYLGYYLPDEDLGAEHSVFVDFFATTKATFSGLGRLARLGRARVVPMYVSYNLTTQHFQLDFYPALPVPTGDDHQDARLVNEFIEQSVGAQPEQYMWILRLLKTRPDTKINPYK